MHAFASLLSDNTGIRNKAWICNDKTEDEIADCYRYLVAFLEIKQTDADEKTAEKLLEDALSIFDIGKNDDR